MQTKLLNDREAEEAISSINKSFNDMQALCTTYMNHLNSYVDTILHPENVTENQPSQRKTKTDEAVRIHEKIPTIQVRFGSNDFEDQLTTFKHELDFNTILEKPRSEDTEAESTEGKKLLAKLSALTINIIIKYADLILPTTVEAAEKAFLLQVGQSYQHYVCEIPEENYRLKHELASSLFHILHPQNANANRVDDVKKYIYSPDFRQGILLGTTAPSLFNFFNPAPTACKIFLDNLDRHVSVLERRVRAIVANTPASQM